MELTQKQELYIARYLRAVADALAGQLGEKQTERALVRLRARIEEQIGGSRASLPQDVDVLNALRRMGAPENQAAVLARVWGGGPAGAAPSQPRSEAISPGEEQPTPVAAPRETIPQQLKLPELETAAAPSPIRADASVDADKAAPTKAVWLGVCGRLAQDLGWPTWALRTLIFFLGLTTGPAALVVYMVVYFWLLTSARIYPTPPLHPLRMILRPILTTLAAVLIHLGAVYAIKGIYFIHEAYLKRPAPDLSEWAWFEAEAGRMLFWTLVVLLPTALLSALPLANSWDYSLKRFTQAGVALYAVLCSFGLASFITGIILAFAREFSGR